MSINARTATAADFDNMAQRDANAFWGWLITSAITWYFLHWWLLIPATLCLWSMTSSVSSSMMEKKLRDGTYKIPNPYNCAPYGVANNIKSSYLTHHCSGTPNGAP